MNFGSKGQQVQSGAIGLGQNASYTEAGGVGKLSGGLGNITLSKGATLTINDAGPQITGMPSAGQPIASGTGPLLQPAPVSTDYSDTGIDTTGTDTTDTGTPTGNWWDNVPGGDQFVSFWGGLSIWQQIAGVAAIGLILVFLLHHKKSS